MDKEINEEYDCSYTRLEELYDFYFEKYCYLKQENKQLKEVIDKVINYIVKETKSMPTNGCKIRLIEILDILNEVSE